MSAMTSRWVALMLTGALSLASGCEGASGGAPADAALDVRDGDLSPADQVAPGERTVEAVCGRWTADRAHDEEGEWTGDVDACEPGRIAEPGPTNTLRRVNLYRWLAGLPPVEFDSTRSEAAQACALAMHANRRITHHIPTDWACRSELAAEAARRSNLATAPGVFAVDMYMVDGGVPNLGHRRWILSNTAGPIGAGSTSSYSCLHILGGSGRADARWTAWPPPGPFPAEAAGVVPWDDLDAAGWSIQSDSLDLRQAEVTVSVAGEARAIDVDTRLDAGFGSTFAIRFHPRGWRIRAGETYRVRVDGLVEGIEYDVEVVACEGLAE